MFDDAVWELVIDYCETSEVAPPWPALRMLYKYNTIPCPICYSKYLETAEELGLVKKDSIGEWRLTEKGYKLAERLWGRGGGE